MPRSLGRPILFAAAFAASLAMPTAYTQTTAGTAGIISGTVTDVSGAVIPGATVEIKNPSLRLRPHHNE